LGGQIAGFVHMTVGDANRNHSDSIVLISASDFISVCTPYPAFIISRQWVS